MTIREAKKQAIKQLKHASGKEAAIDAEILLAHALLITREELLAHDERRVPAFALRRFNSLLARRVKHEPVAYIVGHKEFFGLQFAVNKHTLIPRPETELIVEEALRIITHPTLSYNKRGARSVVIDVGTGSGAIAIAIAKNAPNVTVLATDISKPALKTAESNAIANDVADHIIFERTNLLFHKNSRPRNFVKCIITANLPYLPTKAWQKTAPEVKKFEPRTALDGGRDGLRYYDKLFHQISFYLRPPYARGSGRRERALRWTSERVNFSQAAGDARKGGLTLICEIDPSEKRSFPALVKRHFPKAKIVIKNDLTGLPRVAIITPHFK